MCNCTSGNLDVEETQANLGIPGSMLRIAPE